RETEERTYLQPRWTLCRHDRLDSHGISDRHTPSWKAEVDPPGSRDIGHRQGPFLKRESIVWAHAASAIGVLLSGGENNAALALGQRRVSTNGERFVGPTGPSIGIVQKLVEPSQVGQRH